jgi:NAD+ kinase
MALAVRVKDSDGAVVYSTWALNEATVEKASRERMIEVVVEIDGRPLSSFGCDGVVVSTPTGSTAYNFSAGGPVIWPGVEAIAVVPLSAHALFARPLVVAPARRSRSNCWTATTATASCGATAAARTTCRAARASWCAARRARCARAAAPGAFTDRLVRKFHLPVSGWRGADA